MILFIIKRAVMQAIKASGYPMAIADNGHIFVNKPGTTAPYIVELIFQDAHIDGFPNPMLSGEQDNLWVSYSDEFMAEKVVRYTHQLCDTLWK
jgi:hypothetical protein